MSVKVPDNLFDATSLTEEESRALLEDIRWPDGPVCPHCKSGDVRRLEGKSHRRGLHKCRGCRKQFTVTTGTVMHASKISLSKWLAAMYAVSAHKTGISASQLQRDLGLGSYKTAWYLLQRIRLAMSPEAHSEKLFGTVEVDEAYVGARHKRGSARGRGTNKMMVVAVIQRNGEARAIHLPRCTGETIGNFLTENVSLDSEVMSDELNVYGPAARPFRSHMVIRHKAKEFARGDISTNLVEAFFAIVKRAYHGTFFWWSRKHASRYTAEIAHRWTHRKKSDGLIMVEIIKKAGGRRLRYVDLVA